MRDEVRTGAAVGFAAYTIWGLLTLYWKELQRRNALQRHPVNLDSYRQLDLPALFPLTKLPASHECGKAS